MSAKKFNTPFGILGDRTEVPTTAQIDGSVSFEQGYPFGYELDYTDPNTKDISRSKTNQLLYDITNAIREIQQGGVSEWSEEGKPYKINSLVYAPDGTIKQSLIANNNNDTTHSSWSNLINVSSLAALDTQFVKLTGNQTIDDIKTFTSSPIVPTPTTANQAVNKAYVDNKAGAPFTANDQRVKTALNATGDAPIYACRSWCNFNGVGVVSIRESGNVSSITDNGVGNYTANFTIPIVDQNYQVIGSCGHVNSITSVRPHTLAAYKCTRSSISFNTTIVDTHNPNGGVNDYELVSIAIIR